MPSDGDQKINFNEFLGGMRWIQRVNVPDYYLE